jgi:hypothetical protein
VYQAEGLKIRVETASHSIGSMKLASFLEAIEGPAERDIIRTVIPESTTISDIK